MPSPFPGMDPYLEAPEFFPDFHKSLIVGISTALNQNLPAPYFSRLGERVWFERSQRPNSIEPDAIINQQSSPTSERLPTVSGRGLTIVEAAAPVEIAVPQELRREIFAEIYASEPDRRLVAVIELLSPANKSPGDHGRDRYLRKQKELLGQNVSLVEIDLLRGGTHATAVPFDLAWEQTGGFDYHVSILPGHRPEIYQVYPIRLHNRLPIVTIPLSDSGLTVRLDLPDVFNFYYDGSLFDRQLNYSIAVPPPALTDEQAAWVDQLLRVRGLRPPV